jgi:Ca2+-binding RTX toxin-like protein
MVTRTNTNTYDLSATESAAAEFGSYTANYDAVVLDQTAAPAPSGAPATLGGIVIGDWGNLGYLIEGTSDDDTLYGSKGNDSILGLAGNDTLYGAEGDDTLDGGAGNDILDGGLGADLMFGGDGIDTVTYNYAGSGVTADLAFSTGTIGAAQGDRYSGIENVFGSNFSDDINGNAGDNRLDGSGGNDELSGAGGNDMLFGGTGDDVVAGGRGSDTLIGGLGLDILVGNGVHDIAADTFVLLRHGGRDVITDFQGGVDTIALDGFTPADLGRNGELAVGRVGQDTGNFIGHGLDPGDRLFFNTDTDQLLEASPIFINGNFAGFGPIEVIAMLTNGATIHTFDLDFV